MKFRVIWEAVLLVLAVAAFVVAVAQSPVRLNPTFWLTSASLGLLASAVAMSLRACSVNLAVGAIAALGGVAFYKLVQSGLGHPLAGLVALALAAGVGVVVGGIAMLTKAPGWAVSLIPFAFLPPFVSSWARQRVIPVDEVERAGIDGPIWMLAFAVISLAGAGLFLVPAIRKVLANPLAGFTGSSLLAGLSGIVWTIALGQPSATAETSRMLLAIGAVLLGGVSIVNGRGGLAGTVLAVVLLLFLNVSLSAHRVPIWVTTGVVPAVAILVGIGLSVWRARKGDSSA